MASWAKPGVKCVCIKEPSPQARAAAVGATYPILNVVYTVRAVPLITAGPNKGACCILLREIRNPIIEGFGSVEPGFPLYAFRPLVTRTQEQDLEHFLPLLKTKEMV